MPRCGLRTGWLCLCVAVWSWVDGGRVPAAGGSPGSIPGRWGAMIGEIRRLGQNGCTPAGREPPPDSEYLAHRLSGYSSSPRTASSHSHSRTSARRAAKQPGNRWPARPPTHVPTWPLVAHVHPPPSCRLLHDTKLLPTRGLSCSSVDRWPGRGEWIHILRVVRAPRQVPFFFFLVRALRLCTACVRVCASVKNVML